MRVLQALGARGVRVFPSPSCVGVVQDKLLQKQALARAELPVPMFCEVADPVGLIDADWLARLPAELATRLKALLDNPEGQWRRRRR